MQQQIATATSVDWPTVLALLGALFSLACGSYIYTNRSVGKIYDWVEKKLEHLRANDLAHLENRVKGLEDRERHEP